MELPDTEHQFKSDKEKEEFLACIKEISHELHIMDVSRDQVKEIIIAASSTFGISKPYIRKLARFYHNNKFNEFETEASDLKKIYTEITAPKK